MIREKGVVLVVTLIAIFILVVISGISLVLMTSQARLAEHQLRRIKGFYADEAALVHALEKLERGGVLETTIPIDWGKGKTKEVELNYSSTDEKVNAKIDYGP